VWGVVEESMAEEHGSEFCGINHLALAAERIDDGEADIGRRPARAVDRAAT
jgi:hypothetical protein